MDASEVKVVRAGQGEPGPPTTTHWKYPFRLIQVERETGIQIMSTSYTDEDVAKGSAAYATRRDTGCYFYVLDLSTLPPVEYPA